MTFTKLRSYLDQMGGRVYPYVDLRNPTLQELGKISIPDRYLWRADIEFDSKKGIHYGVIHMDVKKFSSTNPPNIHLTCNHNTIEDLNYVAGEIADIIDSSFFDISANEFNSRHSLVDFRDSNVEEKLTHNMVAEYVGKYAQRFHDVKISRTNYESVPYSTARNPGVSLEKVYVGNTISKKERVQLNQFLLAK